MKFNNLLKEFIRSKDIILFTDDSTTSMEPFIVGKVKLLVTYAKIEELKKGDICVIIFNTNELVCHRIVSCDENRIITKGDNGSTYDWASTQESLIGVVKKIIYDSYYLDMSNFRNTVLNSISVMLSKAKITKDKEIISRTKYKIAHSIQSLLLLLYKKSYNVSEGSK